MSLDRPSDWPGHDGSYEWGHDGSHDFDNTDDDVTDDSSDTWRNRAGRCEGHGRNDMAPTRVASRWTTEGQERANPRATSVATGGATAAPRHARCTQKLRGHGRAMGVDDVGPMGGQRQGLRSCDTGRNADGDARRYVGREDGPKVGRDHEAHD